MKLLEPRSARRAVAISQDSFLGNLYSYRRACNAGIFCGDPGISFAGGSLVGDVTCVAGLDISGVFGGASLRTYGERSVNLRGRDAIPMEGAAGRGTLLSVAAASR